MQSTMTFDRARRASRAVKSEFVASAVCQSIECMNRSFLSNPKGVTALVATRSLFPGTCKTLNFIDQYADERFVFVSEGLDVAKCLCDELATLAEPFAEERLTVDFDKLALREMPPHANSELLRECSAG